MLLPWQTGTITRIENETALTRRFWISVEGIDSFAFAPGQFVTLDLPIHEKPNKRWRSYSIASWPDGSNTFELVIVLLEGGLGTHYLFNECSIGSQLTLRGPLGVFTLPPVLDRDIFLICTGTGVAPFRSMTHHIYNHNIAHREIYLIFGCRKRTDCLYMEELDQLQRDLPSFHYIPTFSREETGTYRNGYVHSVYEELCKNRKSGDNDYAAYFYLCGWKNMIDEAKLRIGEMGYEKKAIHLELYG